MAHLQAKLVARGRRLTLLDLYLRGDPPLPREVDRSTRQYFREFMRRSRTNFAELVVEAVRERMVVRGFRTAAAEDDMGDSAAWDIWKANGLAVESGDVHELMLALGDAYGIAGLDGDGNPIITGEDPRQVATASDPARPQNIVAGLKIFHDSINDMDLAYLYLPGRVMIAGSQRKARTEVSAQNVSFSPMGWDWLDPYLERVVDIEDDDLISVQSLPPQAQDVVPVVRFANKRFRGEFEGHMDILERINHTILQRQVISSFQAFKQRAVIGDLPDTDPQTGQQINYDELFSSDPGAFWRLPTGTDMWESGAGDLTAILSSIEADVQHLAAVTRTPMHYLTPGEASQSAEGASLQREGLVFKTEDRIARATVGWARLMSMAFLFQGDEVRAKLSSLEPLWAPVERYGLAERASASAQAVALPWETLMEQVWQLTPEQLARARTQRTDDQVLAQQAALLAAATGHGPQPPALPPALVVSGD
jgi:hypothetical protein